MCVLFANDCVMVYVLCYCCAFSVFVTLYGFCLCVFVCVSFCACVSVCSRTNHVFECVCDLLCNVALIVFAVIV